MKDDPSASSFHRGPIMPTVSASVNMAPCLELLFERVPYLADVRFAFTTRDVAALAHRARMEGLSKLSSEDRARVVYPEVLLFVHWHERVAVKEGGLAMPAVVSYLGKNYSILDASNVKEFGLIRRVHVVPQLGDLSDVVDIGVVGGAGKLPIVTVFDVKGNAQQVHRRLAVSSHPFLYVGYATMTVVRVVLVSLSLIALLRWPGRVV